ncbi:hypothetical protein GNH96_02295 [Methylococcus geothermalis]|uniref:Uncharacterized protein n=1 Tax=Methylococcus geothermalis TaxID=2681310 RepID=A0A858QBX6_9GAMM|nr:hypothetical protein GNH96_02295 [Methylococcus geothermalis]
MVTSAGSRLDKLSLDTVKLIFKRKSMVDAYGGRWVPVNLPAAHPLRRLFSLTVFDALPEEMEEYWNERYFQGINPPEVLSSEEAVLRFVAATPGAVGYGRAAQVDARVKILLLVQSAGDLGEPP